MVQCQTVMVSYSKDNLLTAGNILQPIAKIKLIFLTDISIFLLTFQTKHINFLQ